MLTYVTMEHIMIPTERKKGGKQMEDKGKMQINEIREDAAEFAEILVKVPKTRKKDIVDLEKKLKEEGKLSKKEEVKVRREKIKDLLAEGLSQKEIYSLLKISKRTCVNDVKFLKEQGLI